MKVKKTLYCLLCLILLTSILATSVYSLPADVKESQLSYVKELTLADGTKTGVKHTHIVLPSGTKYNTQSTDKEANFIEFDLANTHLSVEAINCGDYMTSATKLTTAIDRYNEEHPGQTVLAAVNGDLWMTAVNSNENMSKKVLKVPRGVMISNGEIWSSQEIGMENAVATSNPGTTAAQKASFGVTSSNQPLVGSPHITINIKNTTKNKTVAADGLNRLPANDSIIIYNYRCLDTNYALDDAYEIEIECDSTAFKAGGTVSGTVKAIYPANSKTRPAIGEKTIVITARGKKIASVKDNFAAGDKVTLDCNMIDLIGNTELWQDVTEAMGGHIMVLSEDRVYTSVGGNTEYPVSLIGIKDNGNVMFCSITSTVGGKYQGANYNTIQDFLVDAGYNSVFFLDGGGSTTMVTLEEGTYSVRNHCSDSNGVARSVINGIGVVWNDTPVCEKQGALDYIKVATDLSSFPAQYVPADLLPEVMSGAQNCTITYSKDQKSLDLVVNATTNDPMATLSFSQMKPISADEYKYIVVKAKTNTGKASSLRLFYYTGSLKGVDGSVTISTNIKADDSWNYYTFDMSKQTKWTGDVNGMRVDPFDSSTSNAGDTFSIASITLCKTKEEADLCAKGDYIPEGAFESYEQYKEYIKKQEEANTTVPDTEVITEAPTESESEAEPPTEAPTSPVTTEDKTESSTESVTEAQTSNSTQQPRGCKSATGFGLVLIVAGAGVTFAVKKKKR